MPGMVPTVLDIPMSIAAYLGATSRWLTPNPAQVRPPSPRARERKTVEVPLDMMRAVRSMNKDYKHKSGYISRKLLLQTERNMYQPVQGMPHM